MAPDVDLVIAVHDVRRDFARAVRSAFDGAHPRRPTTARDSAPGTTTASRGSLRGVASRGAGPGPTTARGPGPRGTKSARSTGPDVRVTVVAHNLEAAVVVERLEAEGLGGALAGGTVRVLELADGVPSPTGPFTLGLDRAEARYVSIMGSDDCLEPGALAAWFAIAEARGSAAVLAPMRLDSGRLIRNPVPRPFAGRWWPAALDPVRDRLAPRSAPLGLLRRAVVERLGLRLVPGLRTGEDIPFSARLWFSGERLDLDRTAPAYVIGTDAAERVSVGPKPVDVELAAVRLLRDEPWVESLGGAERRALAITMLRVHVLGSVARRVARGDWSNDDTNAQGEVRWLGALARDWVGVVPAALDPLSRADRLVLDALLADADVERLVAAGGARAGAGRVDAILPARLRHTADREGTLRRYVRERMWW